VKGEEGGGLVRSKSTSGQDKPAKQHKEFEPATI
jgi:hypothetical protein